MLTPRDYDHKIARHLVGEVSVTILGTAQDGGFPQLGCQKNCCTGELAKTHQRFPVSLGITGKDGSYHLVEASRMMPQQFQVWEQHLGHYPPVPNSISLTHAHLGHVDGLGLLGKEVMGASGVNVHCSESVSQFINRTPAYAALVEQGVISLSIWNEGDAYSPSSECGFSVRPIEIPHRSEFSDCHALVIEGDGVNLLFMPDHDSWSETLNRQSIRDWLSRLNVDIVLLDGTFWSADELPHRDMNEIPHPPVTETLERLGPKRQGDPEILFLHLNHTNPLCNPKSKQCEDVHSSGWSVANEGDSFTLERL